MSGLQRRHALRRALGLGALWLGPRASIAGPGSDVDDGRAARAAGAQQPAAALHWRESVTLALGTRIWLRLAHINAAQADVALRAALVAVQRVDEAASLFRDDSALQSLNRHGALHHAPPELRALLHTALRAAEVSEGRFDPTVQPLWRTWYEAQGHMPGANALGAARARLGWREVDLGPRSIRLPRPGMALTLNGIVQGFAADQALAALQRHGVQHALIDTGEWWPLGHDPAGQPWRLGLAEPQRAPAAAPGVGEPSLARSRYLPDLLGDGRALACSSAETLRFTADGSEHHILDPRTGHSPRELAMVVVAARTAAWADALSKPLMMGSAAQALVLARRFGVDVLTVDKAGRRQASAGLRLAG